MPPKERKIALMGFRSVGKSSVTIQFVEQQFVDSYDPTIENTFKKTIKVNGQEYKLEVVDTAGQDEYSILPQSYYLNIDGYVLVYSVISRKSFEVIKIVYEKLLDMKGNIKVPVVLVGNKNDLETERDVSQDEGRRLAESWKCPFLETSAKENVSVTDVFKQIILRVEKSESNEPEKSGCILS